ncbi:MAG TPA: 50S ribosomal protein L3 [Phycisphaerae bacterium]|nr:50S ribosomal protein L3 [Phycisphaerae bacterium]
MPAILGKKVGMTSLYDDQGRQMPVTVIEAGPCQVLQVKTVETDGYNAVQLGFGDLPDRKVSRPMAGHVKKAGARGKRLVREYRTDAVENYEPGATVTVAEFDGVALVDVTGVSKGRGFAGVMKRHGFKGQGASHGTERKHRSAGSIGRGSGIPGRGVAKGKRMAGHMGHEKRTAEKLTLMKVDTDANLLVVKGSVPGPNGGYVVVRSARKVGPAKA